MYFLMFVYESVIEKSKQHSKKPEEQKFKTCMTSALDCALGILLQQSNRS